MHRGFLIYLHFSLIQYKYCQVAKIIEKGLRITTAICRAAQINEKGGQNYYGHLYKNVNQNEVPNGVNTLWILMTIAPLKIHNRQVSNDAKLVKIRSVLNPFRAQFRFQKPVVINSNCAAMII